MQRFKGLLDLLKVASGEKLENMLHIIGGIGPGGSEMQNNVAKGRKYQRRVRAAKCDDEA